MERRTRDGLWVHPLPPSYTNQKATHIKLVKGVAKFNPHVQVLCPTLAAGKDCRKGFKNYKGRYHRPKLLIKNCGDPSLQLWMCEGCKDKFLLRVDVNGSE